MKSILFVCTHNSMRSQMAEALIERIYPGKYKAFSAGTQPTGLNPLAVEALRELGLDITGSRSKSINDLDVKEFDLVVTLCDDAKKACPIIPGRKHLHMALPNPATLAEAVKARDTLTEWISENL